ncbi:MAG: mechanosensitive ion channel family protein [Nanopusillaceae archaeon]
MRNLIIKIILVILLGLSLYVFVKYILDLRGLEYQIAVFSIISIVWIYITRSIASYYYDLYKENKTFALGLKNGIQMISYIFLLIYMLVYFNVSVTYILASSTILGIIAGLALQPILSNLFAGIILLASGSYKPGDEIRIVSSSVPYTVSFLPPYKVFSKDYLHAGYKGIVYEISLFFTKIILETGEIMTVPNNILLNGVIINYSLAKKEVAEKYVKIRFELPQKLDPEMVLNDIKDIIKEFGDFKVYIEEVSEKEYYIIIIEGVANFSNYKLVKSEILKRLIQYRNSKLSNENQNKT